jgi:tetratricopeptide (TPR) repeat protein
MMVLEPTKGLISKPPNLADPKIFQEWLMEQRTCVPPSTILAALQTLDSELSRLRQALFCYITPEFERDFFTHAKACLNSSDLAISGYARGLLAYAYMRKSYSAGEIKEFEGAIEIIPMLERALSLLSDLPKTPFVREAESAMRVSLAHAYISKGDSVRAHQEASEGLFWAKEIEAPISEARARANLIDAAQELGKIQETVMGLENKELQENPTVALFTLYDQVSLADCYIHLGVLDRALRKLEEAKRVYPLLRPHALIQRYKCLFGVGGLDGDIVDTDPGTKPSVWLTAALRCLLKADSLPRLNHSTDQRKELLKEAIQICNNATFLATPAHELHRAWILSVSYLKLGDSHRAWSNIADKHSPHDEWLDIRTKLAGLRLEISLHFGGYELPTEKYEEELKTVFDDASKLALASRYGLAQLLTRWHPKAAAYAAVMPNSIPELHSAIDAIMAVGNQNSVYGQKIAAAFSCESFLRALDFDLRDNLTLVQARLNDRDRAKRESIFLGEYGEVVYWKPCISAVQLVYGLMKVSQSEAHKAAAVRVLQTFGSIPHSEAMYPDFGLLAKIEQGVEKLLAGIITPKGFAIELLTP